MIWLPSTCSNGMSAGQRRDVRGGCRGRGAVRSRIGPAQEIDHRRGPCVLIYWTLLAAATRWSAAARRSGLPGGSIYLRGEGRGPASALAELPGHLLQAGDALGHRWVGGEQRRQPLAAERVGDHQVALGHQPVLLGQRPGGRTGGDLAQRGGQRQRVLRQQRTGGVGLVLAAA